MLTPIRAIKEAMWRARDENPQRAAEHQQALDKIEALKAAAAAYLAEPKSPNTESRLALIHAVEALGK